MYALNSWFDDYVAEVVALDDDPNSGVELCVEGRAWVEAQGRVRFNKMFNDMINDSNDPTLIYGGKLLVKGDYANWCYFAITKVPVALEDSLIIEFIKTIYILNPNNTILLYDIWNQFASQLINDPVREQQLLDAWTADHPVLRRLHDKGRLRRS